jgi:formate hydrogenlyase transcriptional activator
MSSSQPHYDRYRLLLELNNAMVSNLELRDLFFAVSKALKSVFHHDLAQLSLYHAASNSITFHSIDAGERQSKGFLTEGRTVNLNDSPTMKSIIMDQTTWRTDHMDHNPSASRLAAAEGLISGCSVPLISRGNSIGVLSIGSFREAAFTDEDVELLRQIAVQVAICVANALAYKEIEELKNTLAKEKLYLEDEIRSEYFDEIVGESKPLQRVLEQLQTVADTDATVLILGETGTGKELIARALHNQSRRKAKTFVKLNCSAIPTGLLESELFGHERGAFTGAIAQKIGRLELADKGTLFLDEIGDIPSELQPKLLRALQEMEFERLGSTRTLKVDVRLIAATNRDLAKMVADREFRSDLYYRLNVFPIGVPPLRDRSDDIPRLVRHFVSKYAQRLNRQIETIPSDAMRALQQWHWPGNVRELENFMERAVILSRGSVLNVPISELRGSSPPPDSSSKPASAPLSAASSGSDTLEESERQHILKVLAETNWVMSGPDGAAARLGLKRTTLQGKMRKLGIKRQQ